MPIIAGRASAAYGSGFGAVTTVPYAGPFGAYDSLAAVTVPSGGLSTIFFSGIPDGYKHLEIRMFAKFSSLGYGHIAFNTDYASVYSGHNFNGAGSNPTGNFNASSVSQGYFTSGAGTKNTAFNVGIFSILDYASTTKTKTLRGMYGWKQMDGTGYIEATSTGFHRTDAITSISLYPATGTFLENSHIALYGVK